MLTKRVDQVNGTMMLGTFSLALLEREGLEVGDLVHGNIDFEDWARVVHRSDARTEVHIDLVGI